LHAEPNQRRSPPSSSEAVFLQFGDLLVYDGESMVGRWPVLPASA